MFSYVAADVITRTAVVNNQRYPTPAPDDGPSLATTADIYAHWTPAMQERVGG